MAVGRSSAIFTLDRHFGTALDAACSGFGERGALDEYPRSARPDRGRRQDHPDRFRRDHARDRVADDCRDLCLCLLLPPVQQPGLLSARTSPIPAGSSSWCGRSRRSPSSCSAASPGSARISSIRQRRSPGTGSPVTDPGGVARLEMAVHLSGPADRNRQHADRAGRRAAAISS